MSARAFQQAYREALYEAAGSRFRLTPQATTEQLYGGQAFAIITAHNPRSAALSKEKNAARHAALVKEVVALGLAWQDSVGMSPDESWQEAGVILFNVAAEVALELGRQFEQNAVLYSDGEHVGLLWCDDGTIDYFFAEVLARDFL